MTDILDPSFPIEPNPLSFGQVPQKDIRVRVVRLTNMLGESVTVSIEAKSKTDAPSGQPPSGFFWGSLHSQIPFTGSVEFPVEFMPRAEARFTDSITVRTEPQGLVKDDRLEIELAGRGLPAAVNPQ